MGNLKKYQINKRTQKTCLVHEDNWIIEIYIFGGLFTQFRPCCVKIKSEKTYVFKGRQQFIIVFKPTCVMQSSIPKGQKDNNVMHAVT